VASFARLSLFVFLRMGEREYDTGESSRNGSITPQIRVILANLAFLALNN